MRDGSPPRGACSSGSPSPPPAAAPLPVVTDRNGFTLYRFDESKLPMNQWRTDPRIDPPPDRQLLGCDPGTPPDWTIVEYTQRSAFPRVDPPLVGSLQRADGTRQLTVDGCPVYRYRGDRAPGDAAGDGAGGTWFVITAARQ